MSPKLIITQHSLHIAEKKYACTHMLRSARAHPHCISHSSSAHARTRLERVYTPTEQTVRKNPRTQIYANTTSKANMRKENVRTGIDKTWGMRV